MGFTQIAIIEPECIIIFNAAAAADPVSDNKSDEKLGP